MIINENAPKSPVKDSTPLLGGASGSSPPPAYASRDAGPTPISTAQVPYAVYQPAYTQPRVGESAARRFCMAFLVALGIWFLASALLGSIVGGDVHIQRVDRLGGYPVPPDVSLEECATGWSESIRRNPIFDFPYSAGVSFDVPLPSETLLLLSHGALSAGQLKITTSSELTDIARVHVVVHYYTTQVRDTTKVCMLKRKAGESGVGIFTPTTWWNRKRTERLRFEVELVLPRGTASSPLFIKNLVTDVSNFSHDVDALKDIINFGDIHLKGSNGGIHAKSLAAANVAATTSNGAVSLDYLVALSAAVRSSNAAISGNFNVQDSLDLVTSNGAIKVAVAINGSEAAKTLTMRTSNDVIDSTIDLSTTTGKAGNFGLKATTSNGRLTTRITSAPLDSVLTLEARTSNSQASVALPVTYEGSLGLYTSNSAANIQRVDSHEKDPACKAKTDCKSRTRVIETTLVTKGRAEGSVYWERKNSKRGNVTLKSSNGAVAIYV
ncbi:hypothetical protein DFH09DRAFT_349821 [Mycena vulgaris]|nr:hypothetical protein DFH09DRAFT_349821 [Mycena vulgaris]